MQVLLIGGYRFLGRAVIDAAHARGHEVAAFNRGSMEPMPDVEQITGDRDDMRALARRDWDAVIDTSGYIPRHVTASANLLRERTEHYSFVSSLSVYASPLPKGVDEGAPLAEQPAGVDPNDATIAETYGSRKVLCEAAAEAQMPGRVLAVRAGFIVGPHDVSDRMGSWLDRAATARAIIVPGDGASPLQIVDVRDLAEWMVRMAEDRVAGPFNATGPVEALTLLDFARTVVAGVAPATELACIPTGKLAAAGLKPDWTQIAYWSEPEDDGLMQFDVRRARAAHLTYRPLIATVRDTWAWLRTQTHARRIALPADRERDIIAAYRAHVA